MIILLKIALRHLAFLWFSSPPEGKKIFGRVFLCLLGDEPGT